VPVQAVGRGGRQPSRSKDDTGSSSAAASGPARFGEGTAPDRLVICNAALTVPQRSAAARPVLMIVDDLAWLDRVSAAVLGFVAWRLSGIRVEPLVASSSAGLEPGRISPGMRHARSGGMISSESRREGLHVKEFSCPKRCLTSSPA
jgi:hypothetical protein